MIPRRLHLQENVCVVCLVAVFAVSPWGPAADAAWEQAGYSAGGLFPVIVVDPRIADVVYLGSDVSGVYKSTDAGDWKRRFRSEAGGGDSWTLATGSNEKSIQMIEALADGTVWAAFEDAVYKSTDHGTNFTKKHHDRRLVSVGHDGCGSVCCWKETREAVGLRWNYAILIRISYPRCPVA